MRMWHMQTAKARLSEVVRDATDHGPQEIILNGRSIAIVVSREEFDRLNGNQLSLVDFMRQSPLYGQEDLIFERGSSPPYLVNFETTS